MKKTIKVKLNVDLLTYKKGSILTLTHKRNSEEGVFLSPYFKRRIADAKIDNCLTVLHDVKQESDVSLKKPFKAKNNKKKTIGPLEDAK